MSELADRFLEETAFDATHNLETEQKFYDQVKRLLLGFSQKAEKVLSIQGKRKVHRLSISYHDLCQKFESIYAIFPSLISQAMHHCASGKETVPLFVSKNLARLPGLVAKLNENHATYSLPEGSGAWGASQLATALPILKQLEDTPLFKHIECFSSATCFEKDATEKEVDNFLNISTSSSPTHIVSKGIAYRIDRSFDKDDLEENSTSRWPFSFIQEEGAWFLQADSGITLMVNQEEVKTKKRLHINDLIIVDAAEKKETYLVISVFS